MSDHEAGACGRVYVAQEGFDTALHTKKGLVKGRGNASWVFEKAGWLFASRMFPVNKMVEINITKVVWNVSPVSHTPPLQYPELSLPPSHPRSLHPFPPDLRPLPPNEPSVY